MKGSKAGIDQEIKSKNYSYIPILPTFSFKIKIFVLYNASLLKE